MIAILLALYGCVWATFTLYEVELEARSLGEEKDRQKQSEGGRWSCCWRGFVRERLWGTWERERGEVSAKETLRSKLHFFRNVVVIDVDVDNVELTKHPPLQWRRSHQWSGDCRALAPPFSDTFKNSSPLFPLLSLLWITFLFKSHFPPFSTFALAKLVLPVSLTFFISVFSNTIHGKGNNDFWSCN